ncbi:hypothetical protein [Deefgea sp. CFH1-16]|uniref:hypothetical protein n=1 Tax=Deefgea sp. CFH1-16 TaxID=2675457 RepID=UPI0015F6AE46|nr:hypothetical protein [Deefgea sp. CFH1-16]MBM5574889.1 hypothetical protein [Deefgea sp. CFH1-16]
MQTETGTMNIAEELSATQIGKASIAYTEALATLSEPVKKPRQYLLLATLGFALSMTVLTGLGDWIISGIFTIKPTVYFLGFFCAIFAAFLIINLYDEIRQMRKRLDAAIVLLNLTSQKEIDLIKNKL